MKNKKIKRKLKIKTTSKIKKMKIVLRKSKTNRGPKLPLKNFKNKN